MRQDRWCCVLGSTQGLRWPSIEERPFSSCCVCGVYSEGSIHQLIRTEAVAAHRMKPNLSFLISSVQTARCSDRYRIECVDCHLFHLLELRLARLLISQRGLNYSGRSELQVAAQISALNV